MSTIKNLSRNELAEYVSRQLNHFFPDQHPVSADVFSPVMEEAVERIITCINSVRAWKMDEFDYLHSAQYCIFLQYLANSFWKSGGDPQVCIKLFYLNKVLNGFDCFYDCELPDRMFIGHSVGIVIAKNRFPDYLALYQGVTIGRVADRFPKFLGGALLYPNSSVIGGCVIGANTVISPGCNVVHHETPGNCVVLANGREYVHKPSKASHLDEIFRIS